MTTCSIWLEYRLHEYQIAGRQCSNFDIFANEAAQQRIEIDYDLVQVDDPRRKHGFAAESKELAGDGGGPVRR